MQVYCKQDGNEPEGGVSIAAVILTSTLPQWDRGKSAVSRILFMLLRIPSNLRSSICLWVLVADTAFPS